MSSPLARNVLEHHTLLQYFERCVCVNKKTVYQGDFLFDSSAMTLSEGKWITNLERMKTGKAPIGHRGIVSKEKSLTLTPQEILRIQSKYCIELHHLTQKDTGSVQDPICEMTHAAHMGNNARFILEFDDKNREIYIVHSSLEKEEALKLCGPNQFIVSNVLHFRKGKSLIDRKQFEKWRTDYWKMRATNIENPKRLHSLNNKNVCKRLIF